jgi:hypothetical protein
MPPKKASDGSTKKKVFWHSDAVGDGKSSIAIVIEWLSNETNYVRWKGGDKHSGATKSSLATEMKSIMIANGILHRKSKDILTKITTIEASYKDANDWEANTGQGVECELSIKKEKLRRCPYYFEIDPVMRDRPSTKALATSDDIEIRMNSDITEEISGADDDPPLKTEIRRNEQKNTAKGALQDWTDMNNQSLQMKEKEVRIQQSENN